MLSNYIIKSTNSKLFIPYFPNYLYNLHATIYIDYQSLLKYKEVYGNLMIPQKFKFNDTILSDLNGSGKKLGSHVKLIRNLYNKNKNLVNAEDKRKLDEIGFIWNSHDKKFELTVKGLYTYKEIYGNLIIPLAFIVPYNSVKWNFELWGLKLGKLHHNLRSKKKLLYKSKILKDFDLELHNLRYDTGKYILLALEIYLKLYFPHINNQNVPSNFKLEIPRDFVIPNDDKQWPKSVWGMKLGLKVFNIKYNEYFIIYHDEFRKLGLYIPLEDNHITLNNNEHRN